MSNFEKSILPVVAAALLTTGTAGADPAMEELLDVLKDRGSITEEEHKRIKESAAAAKEKQPKITTKGKLQFEGDDFTWRIIGRIQTDAGISDEGFGHGTIIRRARIGISGKMYKDWDYKLSYDFPSSEFKGAYLGYKGPVYIRVGQEKIPFMFEEMTSSKNITFMERALPSVFAGSRGLGISTSGNLADQFGWKLALLTDDFSGTSGDGEDPINLTGRFTYSPIHEKTRSVHLGAAFQYSNPQGTESARLRQRPEARAHNGTRLIDTGAIPGVDDFTQFGIEAAGTMGPFSLQGEYIRRMYSREGGGAFFVSDADGNPATGSDPASCTMAGTMGTDRTCRAVSYDDLDFSGWYVEGSWFLTGESRPYDWKGGKFKGVKPSRPFGKGGLGAFQLGLRISELDLTDGNRVRDFEGATDAAGVTELPGYFIDGGKERNLTLGLNWYPNANMAFYANYVNVLDVAGGPRDGMEPSIFQVRAMIFW